MKTILTLVVFLVTLSIGAQEYKTVFSQSPEEVFKGPMIMKGSHDYCRMDSTLEGEKFLRFVSLYGENSVTSTVFENTIPAGSTFMMKYDMSNSPYYCKSYIIIIVGSGDSAMFTTVDLSDFNKDITSVSFKLPIEITAGSHFGLYIVGKGFGYIYDFYGWSIEAPILESSK